jgi:hypothetical protein
MDKAEMDRLWREVYLTRCRAISEKDFTHHAG